MKKRNTVFQHPDLHVRQSAQMGVKMNYDLLRKKPFNLTDAGVAWVKDTLEGLSEEEKIGQLFCLIAYNSEEETLNLL